MKGLFGWGARGAAMSEGRGPWGGRGSGGGGGGDDGDGGDGGGPRNPWGRPGPRRRRPGAGADVTSLDDWLKRSRDRIGRGFPGGGGFNLNRPYWLYGLIAFAVLWIAFTSVHRIGPQERGVVLTFGRYDRTMNPGFNLTFPAPISRVEIVGVEEIRQITIPNGDQENLILTGDQNVIDLAYTVRWNVRDPQLYLFQLRDPDATIREVAESSMRAVLARVSLDDALGAGRSEIEQRVEQNMQQLLNDYGSGIAIQGVSINQSAPPAAVNDAFLAVSAAQQRAQSAQNDARAYAVQLTAKAQGDAAQFEQLYQQYRAAPEVTRRRIYYETMEEILSRVDTTIIEAPGVTPYLPLPALDRRARPAEPQAQPAQPAQPQANQGQRR
jgi:modulator of FtsH protease HflK